VYGDELDKGMLLIEQHHVSQEEALFALRLRHILLMSTFVLIEAVVAEGFREGGVVAAAFGDVQVVAVFSC